MTNNIDYTAKMEKGVLAQIMGYHLEGNPRQACKRWRYCTDEAARQTLYKYGINVKQEKAWETLGIIISCFESLRKHPSSCCPLSETISKCFPERVTIRDLTRIRSRFEEKKDKDSMTFNDFLGVILSNLKKDYPNGKSDLLQTQLLRWTRSLELSCIFDNSKVVKEIFEVREGIPVEEMKSALLSACVVGSLKCVKELTKTPGIPLPCKEGNDYNHQLIEKAGIKGHNDVVNFLLSLENKFNPIDAGSGTIISLDAKGKRKRTEVIENERHALHFAVKDGVTDNIEYLSELVNIPDKTGVTPLILACRDGNDQMVMELLRCEADPNMRDIWGMTALDYCVIFDYQDCFESVLTCERTTEQTKRHGLQILHEKYPGNPALIFFRIFINPNF